MVKKETKFVVVYSGGSSKIGRFIFLLLLATKIVLEECVDTIKHKN